MPTFTFRRPRHIFSDPYDPERLCLDPYHLENLCLHFFSANSSRLALETQLRFRAIAVETQAKVKGLKLSVKFVCGKGLFAKHATRQNYEEKIVKIGLSRQTLNHIPKKRKFSRNSNKTILTNIRRRRLINSLCSAKLSRFDAAARVPVTNVFFIKPSFQFTANLRDESSVCITGFDLKGIFAVSFAPWTGIISSRIEERRLRMARKRNCEPYPMIASIFHDGDDSRQKEISRPMLQRFLEEWKQRRRRDITFIQQFACRRIYLPMKIFLFGGSWKRVSRKMHLHSIARGGFFSRSMHDAPLTNWKPWHHQLRKTSFKSVTAEKQPQNVSFIGNSTEMCSSESVLGCGWPAADFLWNLFLSSSSLFTTKVNWFSNVQSKHRRRHRWRISSIGFEIFSVRTRSQSRHEDILRVLNR